MSSGVVSVCYRDFLFLFVKVLNKAGLVDGYVSNTWHVIQLVSSL